MGGKGSGHKHGYDHQSAVKFYTDTYCEKGDLMAAYGITSRQANRVISEGIEAIKHKVRMQKLTEEIEEFNPEREIQ